MKARRFPSTIQLSTHSRFTLGMLSAVIDQLDHYMALGSFRGKLLKTGLTYDTTHR